VYETDIAKIKQGSNAEITTLSYPDKKFSGRVERISNILNPETNVMTVKIRLSNPDYTLKPGMFANISILFPETEKRLVIPSRSMLFDDNKNYVVLFKKQCDVDMQASMFTNLSTKKRIWQIAACTKETWLFPERIIHIYCFEETMKRKNSLKISFLF
jgi:Membrane-fusion protein